MEVADNLYLTPINQTNHSDFKQNEMNSNLNVTRMSYITGRRNSSLSGLCPKHYVSVLGPTTSYIIFDAL